MLWFLAFLAALGFCLAFNLDRQSKRYEVMWRSSGAAF
jgi:uncharacterized membrane protein YjjB (DUF3815 family)